MDFGTLLFFKKNGQSTKHYPLTTVGEVTLGSSYDADIRLKIEDSNLEPIHCILDAKKENGLVHIVNKSRLKPVKVNGKPVHKIKVLYHNDMVEVPGKSFQYLNENIDQETFDKAEKELKKIDITYVQRGVKSTKKIYTPKLSVYGRASEPRKSEIKKPLFSTPKPKTPSATLNRSKLLAEKSKTTSKVILTKARKSPTNTQKKRRLSLGEHLAKVPESPRVSSRNILLSSEVCKEIATPGTKKSTPSKNTKTPKKVEATRTPAKTPLNKRVEELKQSGAKPPLAKTPKAKLPKKSQAFESPKSTDLASPLELLLTENDSQEVTKTPAMPSRRGRTSRKSTNTPTAVEHITSPLTPSRKGRAKKSVRSPVVKLVSPLKFSSTPLKTRGSRKSVSTPVKLISPVKAKTPVGSVKRGRKSVGTPAHIQSSSVTDVEELREASVSSSRAEISVASIVKDVEGDNKSRRSRKSTVLEEKSLHSSAAGLADDQTEISENDTDVFEKNKEEGNCRTNLEMTRRSGRSRKMPLELEKSMDTSSKSYNVEKELISTQTEEIKGNEANVADNENLNVSSTRRQSRSRFPQENSLNSFSEYASQSGIAKTINEQFEESLEDVNSGSYLDISKRSRASRNTQHHIFEKSINSSLTNLVVNISRIKSGQIEESHDDLDSQEYLETSNRNHSRKSRFTLENAINQEDLMSSEDVDQKLDQSRNHRSSRRQIIEDLDKNQSYEKDSPVNVSHKRKSSIRRKVSPNKSLKVASDIAIFETDPGSQEELNFTSASERNSRLSRNLSRDPSVESIDQGQSGDEESTVNVSLQKKSSVGRKVSSNKSSNSAVFEDVDQKLDQSRNHRSSRRQIIADLDKNQSYEKESPVNVSHQRKSSIRRKVSPNKSLKVASDIAIFETDPGSQEELNFTSASRKNSRLSRKLRRDFSVESIDQGQSGDEESTVNVSQQKKSSVGGKVSPNKSSNSSVFETDPDFQETSNLASEGEEIMEELILTRNSRSSRRHPAIEGLDQSQSDDSTEKVSHQRKSSNSAEEEEPDFQERTSLVSESRKSSRLSRLTNGQEIVEEFSFTRNSRSSRRDPAIEGFNRSHTNDSAVVCHQRKSSIGRQISPNKSVKLASSSDDLDQSHSSKESTVNISHQRNSSIGRKASPNKSLKFASDNEDIDQSQSYKEESTANVQSRNSSIGRKVSLNKSKVASNSESFKTVMDSQEAPDLTSDSRKSARLSRMPIGQEIVNELSFTRNSRSSRKDPVVEDFDQSLSYDSQEAPDLTSDSRKSARLNRIGQEIVNELTFARNRRSSRRDPVVENLDLSLTYESPFNQRKPSIGRQISPKKSIKYPSSSEDLHQSQSNKEDSTLNVSQQRKSCIGRRIPPNESIKFASDNDLDQSQSYEKDSTVNVSQPRKSSIGRKVSLNISTKAASNSDFKTVLDSQEASESQKSSTQSGMPVGQDIVEKWTSRNSRSARRGLPYEGFNRSQSNESTVNVSQSRKSFSGCQTLPNESMKVSSNEVFKTDAQSQEIPDSTSESRKSSRLSRLSNFSRLSKDFVVDIPKVSSKSFSNSRSVALVNTRKSAKLSFVEPSKEILSRTQITPGSPLRLTGRKTYARSKSLSVIPQQMTQSPAKLPERRSFRVNSKNLTKGDLTESSDNTKSLLVSQNDSSLKGKRSEEVFIISSSLENSSWRSGTDVSSRRTSKISKIFKENVSSSSTPYCKFKNNSTALLSRSDNSSAEESTDDDDELSPLSPVGESSAKKVGRYSKKSPTPSSRRSLSYSSQSQDNYSQSNDVISISSTDDKENSLPSSSSLRFGGKSSMYDTSTSLRKSVQYEVKIERRSSRRVNDSSSGHQEEMSSTEERRASLRRNSTTGFLEFTEETVSKSITKRSARLTLDQSDSSRRSLTSKADSTVFDDSSSRDLSIEGTPEVNGENVYEKEVIKSPKRSFLRKSFINPDESTTSSASRVSTRKSVVQQPDDDPLVSETPILTKTPARKSNVTIMEPGSSAKARRSSTSRVETPKQDAVVKITPSATPKSAVKPNRRSRASFYNPVTEEITPVGSPDVNNKSMGDLEVSVHTPDNKKTSDKDGEFKTPINTPGLFESIIHSVIRSRKRGRESTGSALKSSKRLKLNDSVARKELDASQISVTSEVEVQELVIHETKSPKNDLADVRGVKKLLKNPREIKSPKNDLTNVRGVKNLLKTPQETKSPKNDLTRIPNLRRLMSPKVQTSPQNDLTKVPNLRGMISPKVQKSPQNDLTKIPNLRRLISPKTQKSPQNDLREVPNLRWLMSPKQKKNPKNDLTKVPNLRRIMSPKQRKSPKNDLTKIPNLRRVMSPKVQKSPKDDLTNVPNLRWVMSPKGQTEPQNDLNDISGVANIFNVSGVESLQQGSLDDTNSTEELFDKLAGRPLVKTYRARSLSPKRAMTAFDVRRKTFGEKPVMSPRVEKWVEEQVAMTSEEKKEEPKKKKAVVRRKRIMSEADLCAVSNEIEEPQVKTTKRTRGKIVADDENIIVPKSTRSRKKVVDTKGKKTQKNEPENSVDSSEEFDEVFVKTGKSKVEEKPEAISKGRRNITRNRKAAEITEEPKEKYNIENPSKVTRGRRNILKDTEVIIDGVKATAETQDLEESPSKTLKGSARSKKGESAKETQVAEVNTEIPSKVTRGRRNILKDTEVIINNVNAIEETQDVEETSSKNLKGSARSKRGEFTKETEVAEIEEKPVVKRRGRPKKNEVFDEFEKDVEPERIATKSTRGRAKKVEVVDESEKVVEPEQFIKPTRGRRKQTVEVETTDDETEKPVAKKTGARTLRGKKNQEINSDAVVVVDDSLEKQKSPPKKATRGKKGQQKDDVIEEPEENVQEKKTTRARRGQKKEEDTDVNEDNNVQKKGDQELVQKSPVKKSTRGRKGQKKEEIIEVIASDDEENNKEQAKEGKTTSKRRTAKDDQPAGDSETSKSKTTGRGKKKMIVNEDLDLDSPKPKRAKRGATNNKEEDEDIIEGTPQEPVLTTKPKGKTVKQVQNITEVDVDSPRTLRSRRGINYKYDESEYETTPIKNTTTEKKVTFNAEEEVLGKKEVVSKKGKRIRK